MGVLEGRLNRWASQGGTLASHLKAAFQVPTVLLMHLLANMQDATDGGPGVGAKAGSGLMQCTTVPVCMLLLWVGSCTVLPVSLLVLQAPLTNTALLYGKGSRRIPSAGLLSQLATTSQTWAGLKP